MLSHNEAQALISASLDTPLDYDIEQILADHLSECEECRMFAASSQRLASALRSLPTIPESPVVRQAVWEAIEQPPSIWSRAGGVLGGRTATVLSTAAIALLVIAFATAMIIRQLDSGDDDDEGARLAAGTQQAIALATATAEATETMVPTTEPTATQAQPTATAAPPTATQPVPTETAAPPTEAPETVVPTATTETTPSTEPAETSEAQTAGATTPTEAPVDLTGTETPEGAEPTSAAVPALAQVTGTPAPTETAEPTATPAPTETPVPTDTPAPTSTPEPTETPTPEPTATPEPTSTPQPTATPEPTATLPPVPANLTVTLVDGIGAPIGDACWALLDASGSTVAESCDTAQGESSEFASNGNAGFFEVPPGTYTLRMTAAPEGVGVEDREVELAPGSDDTVTITVELPTPTPEPTATPAPTETPAPTNTPEPTSTPAPTSTPEPTETPAPTDAPSATATEAQIIEPIGGETVPAGETPTVTETEEPGDTPAATAPSQQIVSPAEATQAAGGEPTGTEAQVIEPIGTDAPASTPAIEGETPEPFGGDVTPTEDGHGGAGYDLSEAPLYSDGQPWGDINARLGYENGQPVFEQHPDSVSLEHEFLRVDTASSDGASYLEICAEDCEPATRETGGDSAYTDSPIGWVENQLLYQRELGGETELRSLVWDPGAQAPLSDERFGALDGPVTATGLGYPGDNGTLIPTSGGWLLANGGGAEIVDANPYGDIQLVRSNFNADWISYVAGGELIVAERSAPGTAIASIPFSGVDYDISPNLDQVVISTGSGLEIWSLQGELLGSSAPGTSTGSVLWLNEGIVMINLDDGTMRLVDPAVLVP